MFWFTQEPSSGSQSQCLAKITGMDPLCLSIWILSVLWRHMYLPAWDTRGTSQVSWL